MKKHFFWKKFFWPEIYFYINFFSIGRNLAGSCSIIPNVSYFYFPDSVEHFWYLGHCQKMKTHREKVHGSFWPKSSTWGHSYRDRKKQRSIPSFCRSMNFHRQEMIKVSKIISMVWSFFWSYFQRAPTHTLPPIGQNPICGLYQKSRFCRVKCLFAHSEAGGVPTSSKRFALPWVTQ